MTSQLLWTPSEKRKNNSRLVAFADWLKERNLHDWQGDYLRLWQWSVDEKQAFWSSLWDWHGVIGDKSGPVMARLSDGPQAMMQTRFFPDAHVNFAENLLRGYDQPDICALAAISSHHENGTIDRMTRAELADKAMRMAGWLKAQGVQKGDRVAAYIPNIAEAVITMLASSAIGAVYSSCSPDFGFGVQVITIDMIMVINFNQHRFSTDIVDRPGHRRQRIGIGQHQITGLNANHPQGQRNGIPPRRAGQAIIRPLIMGIVLLQQACF